MAFPDIIKGWTFANNDQVSSVKLHALVDLAEWLIQNQVTGDMVYFNGTDWIRIPKGTAGQVLTMNVGATAPEGKTP